jgi:hypothetical protein
MRSFVTVSVCFTFCKRKQNVKMATKRRNSRRETTGFAEVFN